MNNEKLSVQIRLEEWVAKEVDETIELLELAGTRRYGAKSALLEKGVRAVMSDISKAEAEGEELYLFGPMHTMVNSKTKPVTVTMTTETKELLGQLGAHAIACGTRPSHANKAALTLAFVEGCTRAKAGGVKAGRKRGLR